MERCFGRMGQGFGSSVSGLGLGGLGFEVFVLRTRDWV